MTALTRPLRRRTAARLPHGYRPELVVTLHPGGILDLRESHSRRPPVTLDLGALYVTARMKEALAKRPKGRRGKR